MGHIAVIEADHYREEQARLMQDEQVLAMAEALRQHGQVEEFLGDRNAMMVAFHEGNRRGIEAHSIGGVYRALVALLTQD